MDDAFLPCPHMVKGARELHGPLSQDTNPIHTAHLLIQSHERLGIQYEFWGCTNIPNVVVVVGSGGGWVCVYVCTNCSPSDKGNKKGFAYLESICHT